jgi:hypothetical protein
MNRQHGARPVAQRSVTQLTALLVAFAFGGLGLFLFTSPSAHADTASITMSDGSAGTVDIVDGDSVVFIAPSTVKGIPIYNGMTLSGSGLSATLIKPGKSLSLSFSTSGTRGYSWKAACVCLAPTKGSAAIAVADPPPPPPPPDSSTAAPPDSSTAAPPDSSTPPGGGTSTTPGGGTSTTPGGGTSTTPAAHSSGASSHSNGGGGISIGPGPVINTSTNNFPIGFNAPPPDPNQPTPTIPNATGVGLGVVPTGAAGTSSVPASGSSQRTLVEVADSTPVSKSRPTSLAIVSIVALAIVASLFAYRRLGEQVQRPGH